MFPVVTSPGEGVLPYLSSGGFRPCAKGKGGTEGRSRVYLLALGGGVARAFRAPGSLKTAAAKLYGQVLL